MANYAVSKLNYEITTSVAQAIAQMEKLDSRLTKLEGNTRKSTDALQKMAGTMSSFKNIVMTSFGFGSLQQGIYTITNLFRNGVKEATNFVENYNLFNVALRGNTKDQIKFQYELNQAFRSNMTETLRYQGYFQALANSLRITDDASTVLSQNLTKLTYDLASLYNVDVATAQSKLASGIIGQTKPLRTLGIDVTMQTLQPYLADMGISKKVSELTQAEKVLLRYIAILDQSSIAHGDFARTIESPANQLRILSTQFAELTRWIGTMFIGAVGRVLPYINGVVGALKEMFKWASLAFGFNVEDYDYLAEQPDIIGDIEDSIDGATSASDKLKKSLMGFDEINNITENTADNLSLGGTTWVYDKLLEQIKGYDNLMAGVSEKSREVTDNIMSWLGFSKEVNAQTGEITYKYEGIQKTVENMFNSFIGLAQQFQLQFSLIVGLVSSLMLMKLAGWLESARYQFTLFMMAVKSGQISWTALNLSIAASSASLAVMTLGITAFVYAVLEISKVWDQLSKTEQAIVIFNGLAAAAMAAALAIAVFHTSWTVGVGAAAIAAGIAALLTTFAIIDSKTKTATSKIGAKGVQKATVGAGGYTATSPSWQYGSNQIPMYADGGFPTKGQMFIARESGAEMVGSIGGRTAVANNQDIVSAVSQGVASAVAGVMGGGNSDVTVNIELDNVRVGQALIRSVNRATIATGETVLSY